MQEVYDYIKNEIEADIIRVTNSKLIDEDLKNIDRFQRSIECLETLKNNGYKFASHGTVYTVTGLSQKQGYITFKKTGSRSKKICREHYSYILDYTYNTIEE